MARVFFVAGLGYGDEGKGSTVDALTAHLGARLVVRYSGGAQCAHNVITPDGKHHCFAQFGSGTLAGARTHLSRYMLVNPITLLAEADGLYKLGVRNSLSLVTVEDDAPLTTPFHVLANRLRERLRGNGRHGSCGMGIGETMKDVVAGTHLRVVDLLDEKRLVSKLRALQRAKMAEFKHSPEAVVTEEWDRLSDHRLVDQTARAFALFLSEVRVVREGWLKYALKTEETILFEGAQGVLLDQDRGWFPHVTYSDTTFGNAYKLIEGSGITPLRLGVTRAHMTRHGAGPFVSEVPGWNPGGDHNAQGEWQGGFRFGHLDLAALKYAIAVLGGLDGLCVTHTDQPSRSTCGGYATQEKNYIPLPDPATTPDRMAQSMLTDLLMTAQPYLRLFPQGPVAENIAAMLSVPLYTASNGPRRDNVRIMTP